MKLNFKWFKTSFKKLTSSPISQLWKTDTLKYLYNKYEEWLAQVYQKEGGAV